MLRNYFVTTLRQFWKNKFYFSINIFGLASSTAVSVLILLYAYNVLTYDRFHSKVDDIYFMYRDRPSTAGPISVYDTWVPLLEETRRAFPEVTGGTRVIPGSSTWMQYDDKLSNETFTWADSGFFQVFDFKFVEGNPQQAMAGRNNLIISKALKEKMFGNEEAIGKTVRLFFDVDYVVSGVLDEIPANSSFQLNAIVPLHDGLPFIREANWNGSFLYTFILTQPGTEREKLQAKFPVLMEKFVAPSERGNFRLLPMAEYNDEFSNQSKYALMLLGIAFGILMLAAINFTNLASAQSFTRMKEVGMRKTLGATRGRIIFQFISESMILSMLALFVGIGLAQLALPFFSDLVGMPLEFNITGNPTIIFALLGIGTLTGFASGFYPAFFASGFQPVKVLKGLGVHHSKGGGLRTGLLTFQFAIAIFLISGVIIVLQQVDYMKSKDLNFEKDNVMVIRASPRDYADVEQANGKIGIFKNEVENIASVVGVSRSNGIPGNYPGSFSLFVAEGAEKADPFDWRVARVDADYFNTYKIPFIEGRSFIANSETDRQVGAIINQAALKAIGWSTAVGKKLKFPGEDGFLEIIGVTKDFDYASAVNNVEPVVHVYRGEENANYQFLSIQLQPGTHQASIAAISEQWQKINPDRAIEYFFPSDRFSELYNTEENIASIISVASVLAIIIASLGLFALASFNMAQRQKEVAVRKVMGASVPELATMFIKKYLIMVGIALVIAVPLTYYFAEDWLSDFAYRISISPVVVIAAGLTCAAITVLTIGFKSINTAVSNPVKALKYE